MKSFSKDGRVDILLLKYLDSQVEMECIQSILEKTSWPYRLTIHDNRDGTKNMAALWNWYIMNVLQEDYLLIIDSDAVVETGGWLTRMVEFLASNAGCGAVVPRTDHCGEAQQMSVSATSSPRILSHASGFCFLFTREAYESTGPFDEQFGFYGQDAEWFMRMFKETSYRTYLLPSVMVCHRGAHSVRETPGEYDFSADKEKALSLYYEKIGK